MSNLESLNTVCDQAMLRAAEAMRLLQHATEHTFSSTQVDLPPLLASAVLGYQASIPIRDLAEEGYEERPHVTVKYGLHTQDPNDVRALLDGSGPVVLTLGKTGFFAGEDYDVVYVEVESPALHVLNAKLTNALEVTNTYPEYQPHVTVAYVLSGLGEKYAGDGMLAGMSTSVDAVSFIARDHREELLRVAEGAGHPFHGNQFTRDSGNIGKNNSGGTPLSTQGTRVRTPSGKLGVVKQQEWGGFFGQKKGGIRVVHDDGTEKVYAEKDLKPHAGKSKYTFKKNEIYGLEAAALSPLEIEDRAIDLDPEWEAGPEGLTRLFAFDDRRQCAAFLTQLMHHANIENHHPDVMSEDNGVMVTYVTHAAGDKITELDFFGARAADRLARSYRTAIGNGNNQYVQDNPTKGHNAGVTRLTGIFEATKIAHTAFEKEMGKADDDWAGWYAKNVVEEMGGGAPVGAMKEWITEASKIHTGADWPQKYAEHVAGKLQAVPRTAEFNSDQPRADDGKWTSGGGGSGGDKIKAENMEPWKSSGGFEHTGIRWKQPTDPKTGRPIPIKVKTVEEAAILVHEGKVVEVPDVKSAHTLINKLADMAREAKAKGEDAKDYDLCQVSVAGSNMFCAQSLRSKEYPDGVPRIAMPQLGGKPVAGSEADKLPRNPWDKSEVDGSAQFVDYLRGIGVKTERGEIPAANLKASQQELIGSKVAKMMNDPTFDPAKNPIFISNDDYVVDGHHRWAAVVGRDAENGVLGDAKMNFIRVNAPISEVLQLANAWSKKFGIQQVAGVKRTGGG